ncbi:MAG: ABC transporter substrate-binding protein [Planctomycetota bacterium]|jgi:ribose transport system substrate-binding protein
MRKLLIATVCCVAGALLTSCKNKGPKKLSLAVIPKGATHEFWLSVKAGAEKAGKELDVNIDWMAPEKEDDRTQQIAIVENMVLKGVDGIVLAPLDRKALMAPVAKAKAAGIPVVVIDSGLDGADSISFVATDNFKGGQLGGQRTVELIGDKGNLVMLRYQENSASTENRERGWMDVINKHKAKNPGVKVLSEEQRAGATKESAQTAAENLLDRFTKDGKLEIDAIFCPNESSAYGMLMALQNKRFAGKVKYVGFDASQALIRGLFKGEIHGLVLQDPEKMGYLGVKTMVAHLKKQSIEKRVDTGVKLITKEDLDKPETKALVPSVDEWLKDLRKPK